MNKHLRGIISSFLLIGLFVMAWGLWNIDELTPIQLFYMFYFTGIWGMIAMPFFWWIIIEELS